MGRLRRQRPITDARDLVFPGSTASLPAAALAAPTVATAALAASTVAAAAASAASAAAAAAAAATEYSANVLAAAADSPSMPPPSSTGCGASSARPAELRAGLFLPADVCEVLWCALVCCVHWVLCGPRRIESG